MVFVTGVRGQLGYDIVKVLEERQIEYVAPTSEELDITCEDNVRKFIMKYQPEVVVHCAAYTAVDRAEDEESLCRKVNVDGTMFIAKYCKEIDAKMVYISTDYVFSGEGDRPYKVDDQTNPLGVYGQTKLEGELAVKEFLEKYFIIRISWVFGKNGNNFIKTMLRIGKERVEVNVVDDQIGSPTYTVDLAKLICNMIVTEKYGVYHATNEGYCSWAELAAEVFKLAGYKTKVNYISTAEYPTRAIRPLNSRLDKSVLEEMGFSLLPHWKEAVKVFLNEEITYGAD